MDLIFSRVHFMHVHVYWIVLVFSCPICIDCCGDVVYICVHNCVSGVLYSTWLSLVRWLSWAVVCWESLWEYWCIEVLKFFFNGFASSSSLFYRTCGHLIVARSDVIQMSAVLMWNWCCFLLMTWHFTAVLEMHCTTNVVNNSQWCIFT